MSGTRSKIRQLQIGKYFLKLVILLSLTVGFAGASFAQQFDAEYLAREKQFGKQWTAKDKQAGAVTLTR